MVVVDSVFIERVLLKKNYFYCDKDRHKMCCEKLILYNTCRFFTRSNVSGNLAEKLSLNPGAKLDCSLELSKRACDFLLRI